MPLRATNGRSGTGRAGYRRSALSTAGATSRDGAEPGDSGVTAALARDGLRPGRWRDRRCGATGPSNQGSPRAEIALPLPLLSLGRAQLAPVVTAPPVTGHRPRAVGLFADVRVLVGPSPLLVVEVAQAARPARLAAALARALTPHRHCLAAGLPGVQVLLAHTPALERPVAAVNRTSARVVGGPPARVVVLAVSPAEMRAVAAGFRADSSGHSPSESAPSGRRDY